MYHDIHELKSIKAVGEPFLINNLTYLKDDRFLPIDKVKSNLSGSCVNTSASHIGWISKDASAMDAQRSTRLCLDSVPMNSYIKDYGNLYSSTSDITKYKSLYYYREDLPGQIQYYVDPEMTNPLFSPLFPQNTKVYGSIYIDPMNNVHYDFRRSVKQPLNCDDCEIAEIRDIQNHREDILSHIMRSRNKKEYEPIHFNFMTRYYTGSV
jgi:hypothetical protein